MAQPDDLLTYDDAAREIGITVGSLKQAIARGALRSVRVPGQKRKFLRRGAVDRYRDAKRSGTNSPHPAVSPSFGAARSDDPEPLEMLRLVLATAQATAAATRDTVIAGIDAYLCLKFAEAGDRSPGSASGLAQQATPRQAASFSASEEFTTIMREWRERADRGEGGLASERDAPLSSR